MFTNPIPSTDFTIALVGNAICLNPLDISSNPPFKRRVCSFSNLADSTIDTVTPRIASRTAKDPGLSLVRSPPGLGTIAPEEIGLSETVPDTNKDLFGVAINAPPGSAFLAELLSFPAFLDNILSIMSPAKSPEVIS